MAATPPQKRRRQRNQYLVTAGVLLVLAVLLAIAARDVAPISDNNGDETSPSSSNSTAKAPEPDSVAQSSADSNGSADRLIEDDGRTMWVSPTEPVPLDLGYLPPGCQVFVALRPAELQQHDEGEKVLAALGPAGQEAIDEIEQITRMRISAIEQLLVGLRADRSGEWHATYVVQPVSPATVTEVATTVGSAPAQEHAGQSYWVAGGWAYFFPSNANLPPDDAQFVVAEPADIMDIIDLRGAAPPLRREMEQLIEQSEAGRHATLLFAPQHLKTDGRSVFTGSFARLRDGLDWLLGDGLTAVAISLHWDHDFFLELRAAATLDTSAERLERRLRKKVRAMPDQVEVFAYQLEPLPYARRLLARLPAMVRVLASNTRTGRENDHAVARCYLPVAAGHNLLMAAELALAQPRSDSSTSSAEFSRAFEPRTSEPQTIEARLAARVSLSFPRDTLESALTLLGDEMGVEIVILGTDLQLEGITKNQSFGLDLRDRPAEEVLVEVLRRANPDKSATGPEDPRQKLVYVVRPATGDAPPRIEVTTRAAAARRGDVLPSVFGRK